MRARVELLWWEGCPSSGAAHELVRRLMAEAGLDPASLRSIEIDTDVAAERESFVGSPTVLINPNDADRYPRDSFDAMRERVEREGPWPAPYVRDESQEVARAYDAKTTPDVFIFDSDGILRYRGAPDGDHMDEVQNASWLR